MQGTLDFHRKNLQQHGHVNEAWEAAFRSDNELRDTKQALSRIVHGLPTAAHLHATVEDKTASAPSQDDYSDKPIQDVFDGSELGDLSLGASEVKEDISLLEELGSPVDEVHTDDPSGEAENGIPYDMVAAEAYGVLGEEDAYVTGHHEENAPHSTAPLPKVLKVQSVGTGAGGGPPPPIHSSSFDRKLDDRRRRQLQVRRGSATEGRPFRRFETPPPLNEDDEFKLGSTWLEKTHGVRAVNGGRQENHFAAPFATPRQRVYEDRPWPEPLPASSFVETPKGVSTETPKILKKPESDDERAVIRTLRKRLSSFLDGTAA